MHLCVALQESLGLPEPPHFLVPGYTATVDRWLDPRTQQIRTSAEIYPLVRHHQALLNAVFGIGNLSWQTAPCLEGLCDPILLETYRYQFPQLWEDHDLIVRFERSEQFSISYSANYPSLQHKDVFLANIHSLGSGNEQPTPSPSETTTSDSALSADREALSPNVTAQEHRASEELRPEKACSTSSFEEAAIANAERAYKQKLMITHSHSPEIPPDSQIPHAQGYVLRLFVSGHSTATEYTLMSLHQLLENSLRLPYSLKVIDVFKHPEQAEANQISATPTLLRVWPMPVRRIVGDLSDAQRILRILAVRED